MRISNLFSQEELEEIIEDLIRKKDLSSLKPLISYSKNPKSLYHFALLNKQPLSPQLEDIVAQDSEYSYWYAHLVLNGRFEKGEESIARNPYWSYYYAVSVLRGRFEKGEKVIKVIPDLAVKYAIHIIQGRWREAEKLILASKFRDEYVKFVRSKMKASLNDVHPL